jgi:putative oxidoreductase
MYLCRRWIVPEYGGYSDRRQVCENNQASPDHGFRPTKNSRKTSGWVRLCFLKHSHTPGRTIHPTMRNLDTGLAVGGRLLIAVLFLLSGVGKIAASAMVQGYIASAGLPAPLLGYLIAIVIEVGGGLLLLVGFQTRIVALILSIFTLAAALAFHNKFADPNEMIQFFKDIAIIGGLLQVAAFGPGSVSLDARRLNLAH